MAEIDYSQVTGLVHSTESFGSVDGPGIRFIVFMQGCKLRCQYCHNPDTWAMKLFVSVISGVSMVVSLYQVVRPCFRLILSLPSLQRLRS